MISDLDAARELLEAVEPPAGRANVSNAQLIALAQVHATLALVQAQQTANEIEALRLGASPLDEVDVEKIKTEMGQRRTRRQNTLRSRIRAALGV